MGQTFKRTQTRDLSKAKELLKKREFLWFAKKRKVEIVISRVCFSNLSTFASHVQAKQGIQDNLHLSFDRPPDLDCPQSFRLLDFLEYKSVDLRFKARGTFRTGNNRLPTRG